MAQQPQYVRPVQRTPRITYIDQYGNPIQYINQYGQPIVYINQYGQPVPPPSVSKTNPSYNKSYNKSYDYRSNDKSINASYPAALYKARQSQGATTNMYDDCVKEGFIKLEYKKLLKYYRKKYFILTSNFKLYYFNNKNDKNSQQTIDLFHIISMNKLDKNMLEIQSQINQKRKKYTLKFDKFETRNEWFDCINFFISATKSDKGDRDVDDEWCLVDNDNSNELDVDIAIPEQPGMVTPNNNAVDNDIVDFVNNINISNEGKPYSGDASDDDDVEELYDVYTTNQGNTNS